MPWRESSANERFHFVSDTRRGFFPFAELCRRHGVSRKTGYKWLDRFAEHGPQGLADRSHRPQPHEALGQEVPASAYRPSDRPFPNKLPPLDYPTHFEVSRVSHNGGIRWNSRCPNAIWSADFKGQFRMRNRLYCYPLTIQDGFRRFLLACQGLPAPTIEGSIPVFERLFLAYGLRRSLRPEDPAPTQKSVTHQVRIKCDLSSGMDSTSRHLIKGRVR
jgi:hypothetical protein